MLFYIHVQRKLQGLALSIPRQLMFVTTVGHILTLVFKGLVKWGKNSVGWHFGFKLHLIINDCGELLAFQLTPANVDDRKPVPDMTKDLIGKLFGNRGYISQKLFEELYERGLQLVTKSKNKMKNRLVKLIDKILLRKRAVIESVNDILKTSVKSNTLATVVHLTFWLI